MYRIMTVCTGNICRSPVGEYLIREHARQAGLEVEVASSAITDYEIGNYEIGRASCRERV